jgi:hypothetical protein
MVCISNFEGQKEPKSKKNLDFLAHIFGNLKIPGMVYAVCNCKRFFGYIFFFDLFNFIHISLEKILQISRKSCSYFFYSLQILKLLFFDIHSWNPIMNHLTNTNELMWIV